MKKKLKMKYCQRRTNKIVWRHDIGRSKQRWSTKRRSRRLRRCFDSSRISLVFQCFWHLVGEKVSENQKGEKAKKTKNTFPIFLSPLCLPFLLFSFFFFLSFLLSFFLSLFLSLSLSFSVFLSFTISFLYLSFFFSFFFFSLFLGEKNHQNHRNYRKSPKTPKSPKITENTQKPYKNRGAKNNFCKNHEILQK